MLEKLTVIALPALAFLTVAGTIWGAWPTRRSKSVRSDNRNPEQTRQQ